MRCKLPFTLFLVTLLTCLCLAQTEANSAQGNSQQNPPGQGARVYSPDGVKVGERPADAETPELKPVPRDTILVKGAWASASDSSTPLPEGGTIVDNVFKNSYFRLAYPFPADWYQKFTGPPPSDSGFYVVAQLRPTDKFKGPIKGTVLVTAQDLFFSPAPTNNSLELVVRRRDGLRPEYQVERQPKVVNIANHSFIRFDYVAPVADLHWYVLATEIRCHALEFVFTSRDPALLEALIEQMNKMKLPAETDPVSGTGGDDVPVCIKDYASSKNLIHKVDPVITDRKFNPIPVRIIISKTGKVKHIHFLSAWPQQAEIITNALFQWEFKPCLQNGEPVEVETGIMFGQVPPFQVKPTTKQAAQPSPVTN